VDAREGKVRMPRKKFGKVRLAYRFVTELFRHAANLLTPRRQRQAAEIEAAS
jgi:hypothetical protein